MSIILPTYGLTVPSETTRFRDLGKELREFGISVNDVLESFDYNGVDPNLVLTRVAALEAWKTSTDTWIAATNSKINSLRGTPAQRAATTSLPGQTWVDTTTQHEWLGISGTWQLYSTPWTLAMSQQGTEPRARYRLDRGMVEVAGVGAKPGGSYSCFALPAQHRPSRTIMFDDASTTGQGIQISSSGAVNCTQLNATAVSFAGIRFLPAS